MEQQSPMARIFDELVQGYRPYDSFDIEFNVPKALVGNPTVTFPTDFPAGLSVNFHEYLFTIATYKTAYPGRFPQRFKAFMLTPKENMQTHYPITSIDDLKFIRSEDERYFTSLADTINCVMACQAKGVLVTSIVDNEFGCRTAQEMVDYFKQFEQVDSSEFPVFPITTPPATSK
jgi:hypothetical protein